MATTVSDPSVTVVTRSGLDTAATHATQDDRVVYLASHVPLRVFRGRPSEDVVVWVALARRALAAADLERDEEAVHRRAAAAVESALDGAAADAVAVLGAAARAQAGTIFEALVARFGSLNAGETARSRLYAYRRTTESVAEFAATFIRRCHDVSADMTDGERVSHFLRALDEPTAAHVLRQGVPGSLNDAITAARNAEHAAKLVTPHPQQQPAVAASTPPADYVSLLQRVLDRLGDLESRSAPAQPAFAAVAPQQRQPSSARPQQQQQQQQSSRRDRWTPDGIIICNICAQPGHKAVQCQQHPRNRQSGSAPAPTRPRFR
jgi:hypothetical protein